MTSSRRRSRGSVARGRAISSRRWSIVVKSRAGVCSLADSPTNSIASRARARATSSFLSRRNAPVITLARTVIAPNGLARTFQVAKPFGAMTVLANVMTGAFLRDKKLEVARARAREAIEFVGLSAKEHTPARDLTTIDQRRLEMARALATEPRLLLLDEVMAGLNPAEIDQAVALVGKLSKRGLTIIIVEHVMRAIMAVARHIVVLDHGQMIAEGSPKEVVANQDVVRAYLGSGYVHVAAPGENEC